ncbi:MAG: sulfotransferase [Pseudomonadota bacterium]
MAERGAVLPRFVVVGQGKAGTSLLFRRLKGLGEVGLSHPKELHYFNANLDKGPDWYASHFAHHAGQADRVVGEVSPSYLRVGLAAEVARVLGRDTKIIFLLRHPVEQSYSRYLQNLCASAKGGSYSRVMRTLGPRLEKLSAAIGEYYDTFGAERILPLVFERDVAGPGEVYLRRVLDFIGLPHLAPASLEREVNSGVMPRFLFSGGRPLELTSEGQGYTIPPKTLVFCGQERNSRVTREPSQGEVAQALRQQSGWSTGVSAEEYAFWDAHYVAPFAAGLTARFGIDLSAWEGRARALSYPLAPPPAAFRDAARPLVAPGEVAPDEGAPPARAAKAR